MNKPIIIVKNLTKRYGRLKAVNKISFDVPRGKIIAFLGPNDAGITTTLEMLEGLTELFASFYNKRVNAIKLLDKVSLIEKHNSYVSQLSGGQKQRFAIVAAVVNDLEIVFLDEPTTGLVPRAINLSYEIYNLVYNGGFYHWRRSGGIA